MKNLDKSEFINEMLLLGMGFMTQSINEQVKTLDELDLLYDKHIADVVNKNKEETK